MSRRGCPQQGRGRTPLLVVATSAPDPSVIFGANLVGWWQSDSGATTTTWTNKIVASGFDLTQPGAGNRPTINASDANFGGRPSYAFSAASSQRYLTTAVVTLGPFAVFLVAKPTSAAGAPWGTAGVGRYLYGDVGNTINVTVGANVSGKNLAAGWGVFSAARSILHTFDGTHAGHLLYFAGVSQTLTNGAGTANPGTTTQASLVGLAARGNESLIESMTIAEFGIVNRAATSGEATSLQAYHNARYGVT